MSERSVKSSLLQCTIYFSKLSPSLQTIVLTIYRKENRKRTMCSFIIVKHGHHHRKLKRDKPFLSSGSFKASGIIQLYHSSQERDTLTEQQYCNRPFLSQSAVNQLVVSIWFSTCTGSQGFMKGLFSLQPLKKLRYYFPKWNRCFIAIESSQGLERSDWIW